MSNVMNSIPTFPDFYAILFVAAVIVACVLSLAVLASVMSPRGQRIIRDHLGKRLAGTRMWSMLEHRHVSPLNYVDQTPIGELKAQIHACQHCAKQEMCDETLGYVGFRKRNYGYCPNRHAIDAVAPHRTSAAH